MPGSRRKTMRNLTAVSGKKKSKKPSKVASLSAPVKAAVRAVISKTEETKFVAESLQLPSGSATLNTYTGFSSAINTVNEIYAALPQVAVGPGSSQRIGDSIKPTRCVIDLNMCATAHSSLNATDKTVHVFLLTAKSVKSLDNYSSIPISELLDIGNGTNGPFNGASMAQTLPVNTKSFTVLAHKQFRLAKAYGLQVSNSPADATYNVDPSFKRLRLNVKLPQTLKYDADASQYPSNSAPFLVIGYTRNDSSGDSAPTAVDLYVEGRVQMYYKDA